MQPSQRKIQQLFEEFLKQHEQYKDVKLSYAYVAKGFNYVATEEQLQVGEKYTSISSPFPTIYGPAVIFVEPRTGIPVGVFPV